MESCTRSSLQQLVAADSKSSNFCFRNLSQSSNNNVSYASSSNRNFVPQNVLNNEYQSFQHSSTSQPSVLRQGKNAFLKPSQLSFNMNSSEISNTHWARDFNILTSNFASSSVTSAPTQSSHISNFTNSQKYFANDLPNSLTDQPLAQPSASQRSTWLPCSAAVSTSSPSSDPFFDSYLEQAFEKAERLANEQQKISKVEKTFGTLDSIGTEQDDCFDPDYSNLPLFPQENASPPLFRKASCNSGFTTKC
ncbi:hypothetical protein POMI540_4655 [Schizosaccharomyces pombe]|uniref:Uncharacterized protein C1A4.04 n=1 Tax=Schizosaccharomyces pombe (strain 972 / ATCC 24843) TaxID=284812 RepID=YH24_SCHPO|nr:uncharacterized protein SPBC1A4.04 [Schizosaccharomyces pombe]O74337.1 RecName: Full=Uncharacterized protein C1A4.04 [Schizosaccharomyces pombe 972h-]CAA20108.1 sequence orphan [Schizosaccharomyces pombe]|eukprot:NP_595806.1 uncharacterized protein SPBC1A4.04 [Schizosaccharomyces pombe]